jgi:REP element-mobilizing transposase RayT
MRFDSDKRHRRSIRLPGYDYAQIGAYFVTIVTQGRVCLLGEVVNGETRLNDAGRIIQAAWDKLPDHYPGVECDEFIVMPNHVHGIIVLVDDSDSGIDVGAGPRACPGKAKPQKSGQPQGVAPTMSLADVVHRFKTLTTKRYIDGVKASDWTPFAGRLWQRNYYEHVIRGENELNRIREYIRNNPLQWAMDRENPMWTTDRPRRNAEPWEA